MTKSGLRIRGNQECDKVYQTDRNFPSSTYRDAIVIIVENLPVPLDRRVWQEARALRDAGWQVSVICPATPDFPKKHETLEGIHIFRHSLPHEGRGVLGLIIEYASALFWETVLLLRVNAKVGFNVIQICNPPDILFLVALPWKLFGKKLVFDQHDGCPELAGVKFNNARFIKWVMRFFERTTQTLADLVIAANETYREKALAVGKPESKAVSVYSVPDASRFYRTMERSNSPEVLKIGYVGIVNEQDGVENLVEMAKILVKNRGVANFEIDIVGDGPALASIRRYAEETGVDEYVNILGYLTGKDLLDAISVFDIAIIPDPPNEYNNQVSMNKVFEYSMMAIPIVSHPLKETQRLLGDAALYSARSDAEGLADAVHALMDDRERRVSLGLAAQRHIAENYSWAEESRKYVRALESL